MNETFIRADLQLRDLIILIYLKVQLVFGHEFMRPLFLLAISLATSFTHLELTCIELKISSNNFSFLNMLRSSYKGYFSQLICVEHKEKSIVTLVYSGKKKIFKLPSVLLPIIGILTDHTFL